MVNNSIPEKVKNGIYGLFVLKQAIFFDNGKSLVLNNLMITITFYRRIIMGVFRYFAGLVSFANCKYQIYLL